MNNQIPQEGEPFGRVMPNGDVVIKRSWYRFLYELSNEQIAKVDAALAQVTTATATNADALAATVQVLQDNATPGAGDIPPVTPGDNFPPGYIIP